MKGSARRDERSPVTSIGLDTPSDTHTARTSTPGEDINAKPKVEKTFAEFAAEWFETYVKTNNKHSTQRAKDFYLRLHLLPYFGHLALNAITPRCIEEYKREKLVRALAPKTINEHLAVLGQILRTAVEWELLRSAPAIKRLRATAPPIDILQEGEVVQLMQSRGAAVWDDMLLLALHTGLRLGELFGLEWKDVDLDRALLCVRRNVVRGVVGTPKSGRVRYVPLTEQAREMLERRRTASGPVFTASASGFNYSTAEKAIKRMCRRAGVREVGWHVLRHTYATQLVERGAPLRAVQALLGHSTVVMTERYAHVRPTLLRAAIALLESPRPMMSGQPVGNATSPPHSAVAASPVSLG